MRSMKKIKLVYWISTVILSAAMAFSAYSYLTNPVMATGFHHLGFPDYFRIELAYAKFTGVVLLLAPIAARVKEWAYVGFGICFISAIIAHTCSGDPLQLRIMPAIFLSILIVSYLTFRRSLKPISPNR